MKERVHHTIEFLYTPRHTPVHNQSSKHMQYMQVARNNARNISVIASWSILNEAIHSLQLRVLTKRKDEYLPCSWDLVYLHFMSSLYEFQDCYGNRLENLLSLFALTSVGDARLIILFLFCLSYDVLLSSPKKRVVLLSWIKLLLNKMVKHSQPLVLTFNWN